MHKPHLIMVKCFMSRMVGFTKFIPYLTGPGLSRKTEIKSFSAMSPKMEKSMINDFGFELKLYCNGAYVHAPRQTNIPYIQTIRRSI